MMDRDFLEIINFVLSVETMYNSPDRNGMAK